jgi:hypothetical protein
LDMLHAVDAVRELLEKIHVGLECTTVLREQFYRDHRLPERVVENLERFLQLGKKCSARDTPATGTTLSIG